MARLVDAIADLLEDEHGDARTIYRGAVPSSPSYPYWVVWGNVGESSTDNLASGVDSRVPVAWVASVSKRDNAEEAAREVDEASERVVDAVMAHRFTIGQATWLPRHLYSQPAQRDDDLKPAVVLRGVEQFGVKYQP